MNKKLITILQAEIDVSNLSQVYGGDISQAFKLDLADGSCAFLKLNARSLASMFDAEAAALREIAKTQTIKVPKVYKHGVVGDYSYIMMEYINFAAKQKDTATKFGQQLALMHKTTQNNFGWHMDNTIGSTVQYNSPTADWLEFWLNERMLPQLKMAKKNGLSPSFLKKAEEFFSKLGNFFPDKPVPSLLHGDLWGGNWSADSEGNPVIYDPASYYGDREADIAMTELFGRFPRDFYEAYNDCWQLPVEYENRKHLYNFYHVLNHFNLFGGGYGHQAQSMMDEIF